MVKTTSYLIGNTSSVLVSVVLKENIQTNTIKKYVLIGVPESQIKSVTKLLSIEEAKLLLQFIELLREPLSTTPSNNPAVDYSFSPTPDFQCLLSSAYTIGNKWQLVFIIDAISPGATAVPLNKIAEIRDNISAAIAKAESL